MESSFSLPSLLEIKKSFSCHPRCSENFKLKSQKLIESKAQKNREFSAKPFMTQIQESPNLNLSVYHEKEKDLAAQFDEKHLQHRLENDLFEIFNIKRHEIILDIARLMKTVDTKKSSKDALFQHLETYCPKFKISKKRKKYNSIQEATKSANVYSKRCMAYIQCGRRCSRNVKTDEQKYCGLHEILHYGDIETGFLNKNTI